MASETSDSADLALIIKLDHMFRAALDHSTWRSWRDNATKCFKYREGDQWTASEKKVLEDRGQPATVNNQVKVTIDRLVGQFVKQPVRIGYRGRNAPEDEPVAQALSDLFLFIRQNNDLDFEERDMAEDGFTGGFGVLETYISFDDTFQPEIRIRHEDCFNLFPDPFSRRYDWNQDAKYICRAKWMDVSEVKEMYPGKADQVGALASDSSLGLLASVDTLRKEDFNTIYVDPTRRRVRVVEIWYKSQEREVLYLLSNGTTVPKEKMSQKALKALKVSGVDFREIDRINHSMKIGIYTGGVLLSDRTSDRKLFPFIPYFVHRKKDGEPYSMIYTALTIQDAINKRESKALHLLSNHSSVYERGAVRDKNEFANERARADGQAEVEPGSLSQGKVILGTNIDIGQAQLSMHQESKMDFRHVTGINPDALGERSEVRSGVGIARKQGMTDLIIAPIFDNLRRTRSILARVVLELVQKYMTEAKIFTITDNLQETKTIALNTPGADGRTLSVKQGIYDVVVEDLPDTTTVQQEQFATIAQFLPSVLPFGPFWVRMLLQMSDLRNKDEIMKQMDASSMPPPSDAKFSVALQWAQLTAQEKAVFAAKKLGLPELAQIEMQTQTVPANIIQSQTELAKEAMRHHSSEKDRILKSHEIAANAIQAAHGQANTDTQQQMDMAAQQQQTQGQDNGA